MNSTTARTQEILPLVKARLLTTRMATLLGGANRVFRVPPDDISQPLAAEGVQWARVVLLQTTRIWSVEYNPDLPRAFSFLVRVETSRHVGGAALDPTTTLEAAHVEADLLLHEWEPLVRADLTPLKHAMIAVPMYRATAPSDPEVDQERNLWFSSAEFRCRISNDVSPS